MGRVSLDRCFDSATWRLIDAARGQASVYSVYNQTILGRKVKQKDAGHEQNLQRSTKHLFKNSPTEKYLLCSILTVTEKIATSSSAERFCLDNGSDSR